MTPSYSGASVHLRQCPIAFVHNDHKISIRLIIFWKQYLFVGKQSIVIHVDMYDYKWLVHKQLVRSGKHLLRIMILYCQLTSLGISITKPYCSNIRIETMKTCKNIVKLPLSLLTVISNLSCSLTVKKV